MQRAFHSIWLVTAAATAVSCTHVDGYADRPAGYLQSLEHYNKAFSSVALGQYDLEGNKLIAETDNGKRSQIRANMRYLRDRIVEEQLTVYDYEFTKFISELTGLNVIGNTAVDWASLAMTGLVATVGGESTKAALGAASTGLIGARATFQKQIFAEKTVPVLVAAMVSERTRILALIRTGLANDVTEYDLYRALKDIESYHAAASINGALIKITENAGAETKAENEKIESITAAADDNTKLIRDFWAPDGAINSSNQTELLNWMGRNGLKTDNRGDIPNFLRANEFKDLRAKAASDLGLPK